MDVWNEAQALGPWMTQVRRTLHRWPEPGNREFRTADLVERELTAMGLTPVRLLDTAVTAEISGPKPGKTMALRADLDALPLTERTGLPYASENPGMMHACGHDLHTAALLGAAKLLCTHRDRLAGTVRLIFQPDEEGDGGAERLIRLGVMDGVDWVFGAHVRPELPVGTVAVRPGAFYAASNPFTITLKGTSAHGAEPQNGSDALLAACQLVTALQSLISRRTAPTEPAVLTVGTLHAGTAGNVLAGEAVLTGMLRTFGEESRKRLTGAMEQMVRGVAQAMDVEADVQLHWGYPGVVNDPSAAALLERAARSLPLTVTTQEPVMTTEDFGYYQQQAPGCFWHMGVGSQAPLHADTFNPDERALPMLAAVHVRAVLEAMRQI